MGRKLTKEEFIEKARRVHGDKYDYSLVEYKNNNTKVKIICPIHGEFEQIVGSHLNGHGCRFCSIDKQTFTTQEFIEKAKEIHGDKYDYSLVEYKRSRDKVKIICSEHGEFEQTANGHLKGLGCIKCDFDNRKLGKESFIEKAKMIHGNKYDYSLVEYRNSKTKVKIICFIHGIFEQNPNTHLNGFGCPICNESHGEKIIRVYLENNNIKYIPQKTFEDCRGIVRKLPFDFYLPDYNLLIEFDGRHHFEIDEYFGGKSKFEKTKKNDNIKNKYAKENNIKLIRISYKKEKEIENILEGIKYEM